ncbi:hypothetical protein PI23P_03362 [Polaribacter irgensii 23-P]|jgi:VanZ family protein|uniref:VanZ-like domain-containing protein n=1 Tax=Polaribacter irgensii 23-P TaxID=313594 RepID=A4BX09_9FLAO|nr:VanZ family protein [Polaribacter irgensii]EAR13500.1 hypothetical protein PI23P_03362 [Polaribacter irgensii 23-P]
MNFLLKDKFKSIALIVSVGILYLSLIKIPIHESIQIKHLDKLQHGVAYATLCITWLIALQKKQKKYAIALCCILFGMIIEVLQYAITNYRTGDYLDVAANSLGVLLGLLLFHQISKKNRLKKEKTSN